jgi:hypothetical protein
VHVVGDLVALCVGDGGVGGEGFVGGVFGIELDQEVVIVENLERVFEGCPCWQVCDMM